MIVAPSLLIVVPRESWISLSMPSGPWPAARERQQGGRRDARRKRARETRQRRAHGVHDHAAGVDVADQLRLALRRVRAFAQDNHLRSAWEGAWIHYGD